MMSLRNINPRMRGQLYLTNWLSIKEGLKMAKQAFTILLIVALMTILTGCQPGNQNMEKPVSVAVEYNNHAACAYIAQAKGWFDEEGLELIPVFQIYESGAAIAAALARGDIQVGYMGLTGAIMAYARGMPIKVVAGVHKYGYGLVVRPEIKEIEDLSGKTIGCLREGTVTDLLLNLMIDNYHLNNMTVLRMSPVEEVIALIGGRLDAALIPEQHATMAESKGYPMLVESQDLWPGMQGDVLVVKAELIEANPELIERLLKVTQKATTWVNEHPNEAADLMAEQLRVAGGIIFLTREAETTANLEITPEVMSRSMSRVIYTTDTDPKVVQETIDYMAELGYLKEGIRAAEILDLRYL